MEKVREILAKDSLNAEDISYLVANKNLAEEEILVRLGLAPTTPLVEVSEQVIEKTLPSGTVMVANKIKEEQSQPPQKRGRPSKKIIS